MAEAKGRSARAPVVGPQTPSFMGLRSGRGTGKDVVVRGLIHFFLDDRVAVDVGLICRWIDVEPSRHLEILRPAPRFQKYRRDGS